MYRPNPKTYKLIILKHSLHSLFSGNFLIDKGYASSFVPALVKAFTGDVQPMGSERLEQLQNSAVAKTAMASSDGGTSKWVAVISIKQPILKFTDEYMGFLGSKFYMRLMDSLQSDPTCAGIVLDIDSGGGQVYGTGEFYDYITAYPKPVVTYTDGYLCSAAYYIGNAANYIVANKRADAIGSIGAYATFLDFTGLWEKLGAKSHTLYASLSTEKNFESREITNAANYEPYIKNVLDPIVATFHTDMKATRPGLNEAVFAGSTWSGPEALAMGLVDELGTLDTAILKVHELDNLQSNNQNSNNMSTPRANLQAVLGLGTTPLAETAEKGTYLNAGQLDSIETDLTTKDGTIATLTTEAATAATAQATAETNLAEANTTHTTTITAHEGAVDTILTAAGITPTGTLTEKIAALGAHQAVLNAKDGAKPTAVIVGAGNDAGGGSNIVSGFNLDEALNC